MTDIHPFTHTFTYALTHRRRSQPRRATASSGAIRVRCLSEIHPIRAAKEESVPARLTSGRETTRASLYVPYDVTAQSLVSMQRGKRQRSPEVEQRRGRRMKVYFCGSIRGGRDDVHVYRRIVHTLQSYGSVLTEHVGCTELGDRGEDAAVERVIHDRDMSWLQQADVIVAEVTQPSLGVGYELGRAVHMKKKVFCLFRPASGRSLSAMIRGADDGELFVVKDYSEEEVENVLEEFFNNLKRI